MAEFSISVDKVLAQRNYLNDVSDVLAQCKSLVDNASEGLLPIGLIGVKPAIEVIELRLAKHQKNCESISGALDQIVRRFQLAEGNILGQKSLIEMLRELGEAAAEKIQDFAQMAYDAFEQFVFGGEKTSKTPSGDDYVGVIYLINDEGAVNQGHAALMLIKADGTYEYFSFRGKDGLFCDAEMDIAMDGKNDRYSNYVYIPIDNADGIKMHDYALDILSDPGKYNVLKRNCNIIAQEILHEGNVDFAPRRFDGVDTRPNTVYQNFMEKVKANPGKYEGYHFGDITNNDPRDWLKTGELDHLISGCDCDVANIDNVEFKDPMGWVNVLAQGDSRGYTWKAGGHWLSNTYDNFVTGYENGVERYHHGNEYAQSVFNQGMDWLQDNYITNDHVNTLYEGSQTIINIGWDAAQDFSESVTDMIDDILTGNFDWTLLLA